MYFFQTTPPLFIWLLWKMDRTYAMLIYTRPQKYSVTMEIKPNEFHESYTQTLIERMLLNSSGQDKIPQWRILNTSKMSCLKLWASSWSSLPTKISVICAKMFVVPFSLEEHTHTEYIHTINTKNSLVVQNVQTIHLVIVKQNSSCLNCGDVLHFGTPMGNFLQTLHFPMPEHYLRALVNST